MAEAAPAKSLGDFFAKKKTKKIKALNLNTQPVIEKKEGDAVGADKAKKKDQDKDKKEGEWVEEEKEQQTGPKSALGQLERDYEEEEQAKPAPKAWGTAPAANEKGLGKGKGAATRFQNQKAFPTLQASTTGVPIGAHREETVLVGTKKKNVFAGLADSDDDEDKPNRQRQGLSRKKQGEADIALGTSPRGELTKEEQERREEKNRKKEEKKEKKNELKAQREEEEDDEAEEEEEAAADTLIVMDTEGAQQKFVNKRKLPKTTLPASELKEQAKQVAKKKMKFKQAEPEKKKLIMEIDAKDDAW